MEEILHELREHAAGPQRRSLGLHLQPDQGLPRRPGDGPAGPRPGHDGRAVHARLHPGCSCATCHRRGAHAIGGMRAFIPNRREPEVTANALARVREDKEREAGDGFDGTWVAHPDLVPVAMASLRPACSADRPNQKDRQRERPVRRRRRRCSRSRCPAAGSPKPARARTSASRSSTSTTGCAATARPRSTTSWRTWRRPRSAARSCGSGGTTARRWTTARRSTTPATRGSATRSWSRIGRDGGRVAEAAELLDGLVLTDEFAEFLTLEAYRRLD